MYATELEEITLQVDSEVISQKNRKLKAVWSYEAAQDIRSMHNTQAENELAKKLAEEINAEIDREILNDIANNAYPAWNVNLPSWIAPAAQPVQEEIPWGSGRRSDPSTGTSTKIGNRPLLRLRQELLPHQPHHHQGIFEGRMRHRTLDPRPFHAQL